MLQKRRQMKLFVILFFNVKPEYWSVLAFVFEKKNVLNNIKLLEIEILNIGKF